MFGNVVKDATEFRCYCVLNSYVVTTNGCLSDVATLVLVWLTLLPESILTAESFAVEGEFATTDTTIGSTYNAILAFVQLFSSTFSSLVVKFPFFSVFLFLQLLRHCSCCCS